MQTTLHRTRCTTTQCKPCQCGCAGRRSGKRHVHAGATQFRQAPGEVIRVQVRRSGRAAVRCRSRRLNCGSRTQPSSPRRLGPFWPLAHAQQPARPTREPGEASAGRHRMRTAVRTCLSSSAFFSRTRRRSIASSRRCETAAVVRNTDGSNFSYSWNCVAQHGLPVGTIPGTTQTVGSAHLDSPGAGERVHALKAMHVMVFVRCAPLGQLVQPLTHQVRGATLDRLAHTPSPLARLPAPLRCGR